MKTQLFFASLLLLPVFISCNSESEKPGSGISDLKMQKSSAPYSEKADADDKQRIPVGKLSPLTADSIAVTRQTGTISNADWDSKIIKTASMKLEIKDFKKYSDFVHNSVKLHGAYVAKEEQVLTGEKTETAITIKVPVAQFEDMMNTLPGDDGKVTEKQINTDDVTGEMFDTKARLEAKKLVRLKYLEFLKGTKNTEEVMQVQNEINDIQEQIEGATGRVAFLSHQAAFSTINLTFYQPMDGYQPTDATPSFLTRITTAFKNGMGVVGDLLVALMSIWPLMVLGTGIYMAWKMLRTKKIINHTV